MKNETNELIKQLANKLGVTVGKLWNIMLLQVRTEIMIYIINFFMCVIFGVVIYLVHKKLLTKKDEYNTYYEWHDDYLGFIMAIITLMWSVWLLCSLFMIGNFITLISNPEYWILEQLLNI